MEQTIPVIKSRFFDRLPDPRFVILCLLMGYLLLGFTVLGFNRSPLQVVITSTSAVVLETFLFRIFKGRWEFPLSALITSMGLSILLNYSHSYYLLLFPVICAIGTKYVVTFQGRHVYNPAMIGVVLSLFFSGELITAAPAYQWNGITSMAYFVLFPALMFFMPSINRLWLVGSFLIAYTAQTALRALIMRHHLPFETLFFGTLSSPSFLLFTFFMITDPKTSPPTKKMQIQTGVALAVLDLIFHIRKSYYTFFFASFTLQSFRWFQWHVTAARAEGWGKYIRTRFWTSGYYLRPLLIGGLLGFYLLLLRGTPFFSAPQVKNLDWNFETIPPQTTGITAEWGHVYERLDPGVQNIAKWVMSVGDSVATGDFDGDGLQDLFFTLPLKSDADRMALYRNKGNFQFERVRIPAIETRAKEIEQYGLPTNAMFLDFDNNGTLDLFVTTAFGRSVLLKNSRNAKGQVEWTDIADSVGLSDITNSVSANWLDFNRDGLLDVVIGNVLRLTLLDYPQVTPLNFFHLPKPEYPGDRRMFRFMHESWNFANNGGGNWLYLQGKDGKFVKQDSQRLGIPETRWTLAIGTGDLNQDGWTDLYVANDFGPDDLYYNREGKRFENIKGELFGSIGKDTYKGMNASVQDMNRDGWLDAYVSNVHHDLQAEGSLLWMFTPPKKAGAPPVITDQATQLGALNERRFGWGAALADFDNDGWLDIAQANGMVDDSIDKRWDDCPDYWYVNEKIARSPPSIHSYSDAWGDIRGMCIHGKEKNRLYLNRGNGAKPQFVDVADSIGMTEATNSRGMAAVDLDNDGRLDLVVTHLFRGPTVYRNHLNATQTTGWIGITLEGDGVRCNRQGIGSKVSLEILDQNGKLLSNDGLVSTAEAQVVDGFSAQNDRRMHFGLGRNLPPGATVRAHVSWCQQWNQIHENLIPNQNLTLKMQ